MKVDYGERMLMRVRRKGSRKLWLKIPFIVILLLVLSIGIYALTVYNNAKKTVNDKMHDPVESIRKKVIKAVQML